MKSTQKRPSIIVKLLCIIYFLITSSLCVAHNKSAITYTFSGGRFGDNLIAYMHAKWLSYKFNMPLLYKPFKYSQLLALHHKEQILSKEKEKAFEAKVTISLESDIHQDNCVPILYTCPYFPENIYELKTESHSTYIKVNWEDKGFKEELKKCLSPLSPVKKCLLPKDRISVALHMRIGTGWDCAERFFNAPTKFPPESYYIEQLQQLYDYFNRKPFYVFIFTDHTYPKDIVTEFKKKFSDSDIMFDSRDRSSGEMNIIEDFFSLTQFDCLIRPDSNFSIAASKIADYKIIISPVSCIATRNKVIINQVDFQVNIPQKPGTN
jgi:hypothetical protein